MKLVLQKGQKESGVMSKNVVFQLTATAELTEEEAANVKKYKVGNAVLFSNDDKSSSDGFIKAFTKAATSITLTVSDLTSGSTYTTKDINEMLHLEESIKQACGNLKAILEAMASFGGEEIFEY
jgi:ABC-type branched-subunit amino acid transport system substrate-binding protein